MHPDLMNFKNSLFNVSDPLSEDIGLRCLYKNPSCIAEQDAFTITAIQRDYKGDIIYRLMGDNDKTGFGRPASPDKIFVLEDEDRLRVASEKTKRLSEALLENYYDSL